MPMLRLAALAAVFSLQMCSKADEKKDEGATRPTTTAPAKPVAAVEDAGTPAVADAGAAIADAGAPSTPDAGAAHAPDAGTAKPGKKAGKKSK
jgi:16S rRNA C1402 (ribose-2'-O) methylase RsmI